MRLSLLALPWLLALAACGDDPPTAAPERVENADPRPVMGVERRIVIIVPADGAGAFPGQLEAALRAQGINARITPVSAERLGEVLDDPARRPELVVSEAPVPAPGLAALVVDFGAELDAVTRDRVASALPPAARLP